MQIGLKTEGWKVRSGENSLDESFGGEITCIKEVWFRKVGSGTIVGRGKNSVLDESARGGENRKFG